MRVADPRHAEIQHLHLRQLAADQHDVRRLDVAMDHAARVRCADRLRHPPRELQALGRRQREPHHALAERLAVDPLHREPHARVVGAVGDVAHDPRVPQPRQHADLAREPLARLPRLAPEHLHRDPLAGAPVARAEHRAHPTRAGDRLQLESTVHDVARLHAPGERTLTRYLAASARLRIRPATGAATWPPLP
jgi:hypothetical protein